MNDNTPGSARDAGRACVAGALITVAGGAATQIARAGTDVPAGAWNHPWTEGTFVAVSVLWSLAHLLVLAGLTGLGRIAPWGASRVAATGLRAAVLRAVATWWDGVELWLTQLDFAMQVVLVVAVVGPVCWGAAAVIDTVVERSVAARLEAAERRQRRTTSSTPEA